MNILKSVKKIAFTRGLKNNFIWTAAGKVIYAFSQWLLIVIIVRISGVSNLGEFSLAMAVTTPIYMFASMKIPILFATDQKDQFSFMEYKHLTYLMLVFAFFCSLFVSWVMGSDSDRMFTVLLLSVIKSLEMTSDIHFSVLRKNEEVKSIAISLVLRGLLSVILFSIFLIVSNSLIFSLLSLILVRVVILLVYDIRNTSVYIYNLYTKNSSREIMRIRILFMSALPLGFVILLDSLFVLSPRFFVEYYMGVEELGYFTSLVSLLVVSGTILSSVTQTIEPRLSVYYSDNKIKKFSRLVVMSMAFNLGVVSVFIVIVSRYGGFLLGLIYGDDFIKYESILWWFVLMLFVSYPVAIINSVLTIIRVVKIQPVLIGIALIISLILSFILVKSYGMTGIVWAMTGGWSFLLFGNAVIIYNKVNTTMKYITHV